MNGVVRFRLDSSFGNVIHIVNSQQQQQKKEV